MKKKELWNRCSRFFGFFDLLRDINNCPYEDARKFPIGNFIYESSLERKTDDDNVTMDTFQNGRNIAFTLGFIIGKEVDVTYREAQADIETIKKVIREKGLLPYLPRERRTP